MLALLCWATPVGVVKTFGSITKQLAEVVKTFGGRGCWPGIRELSNLPPIHSKTAPTASRLSSGWSLNEANHNPKRERGKVQLEACARQAGAAGFQ